MENKKLDNLLEAYHLIYAAKKLYNDANIKEYNKIFDKLLKENAQIFYEIGKKVYNIKEK